MITKDDHPTSGAARVDQPRSAGRGQPGARSRPAETATATCQTGTAPMQNRASIAAAAASIAASASAHADPAGPGNTGSGASARHQRVNTTRTASTRPAKRRNQPRTVSAGRPSSAAIRRCPSPAALAASAAPITATVSARRTSTNTGSSTCVARHPVHRDRRGDIHTEPSRPRTDRARARPHPAQHARAPRTRQPARSQAFLDHNRVGLYREHRASERNNTALPQLPAKKTQREGRGLPRPEDRHGGGADEHGQHDSPGAIQIGTLNDANQALRRHPEWRPTLRLLRAKVNFLLGSGSLPHTASRSGAATRAASGDCRSCGSRETDSRRRTRSRANPPRDSARSIRFPHSRDTAFEPLCWCGRTSRGAHSVDPDKLVRVIQDLAACCRQRDSMWPR